MRAALLCALLLMGGCATPGGGMDLTHLDAAQLKALVADKNFTAICSTFTGAGGQVKFVYSNVDRTVVTNGTITVAPDNGCAVTMTNAPNPPKP